VEKERRLRRRAKEIRILIAVQHDLDRRGLRSVLEDRREWKVCGESTTGEETIEKVRTAAPDLVVLDLCMPDIDVGKAIPQILGACSTVKIIVLASHGSGELAATALAVGAKGIALKSEAATALRQAVQSVGDDQAFLSPAAVPLVRDQLAKPEVAGGTADLTRRELQVLAALARGCSNNELAELLGISVKTVNAHRANIMRKLKASSYGELVSVAIRQGIIEG